ncbi:hypothetical protein ACFE04_014022 [Oxalis oulophora]
MARLMKIFFLQGSLDKETYTLSPLIYVLCIRGLTSILKSKYDVGLIEGVSLSRERASKQSCLQLKLSLEENGKASKQDLQDGNYLGLPIILGRNKLRSFDFIKYRLGKSFERRNMEDWGREYFVIHFLDACQKVSKLMFEPDRRWDENLTGYHVGTEIIGTSLRPNGVIVYNAWNKIWSSVLPPEGLPLVERNLGAHEDGCGHTVGSGQF